MLRSSIVRQARLVRAPVSASISASLVASAGSKQARYTAVKVATSPLGLAKAFSVIRSCRAYSSAAEARSADSANDSSAPIKLFTDLGRLGVHENLADAITQDMGYTTMTDVQSLTITPGLEGKDMVAQAKTGTGKTLAFLVPVIQRILAADASLATPSPYNRDQFTRESKIDIRAIIISPTRELAEQIAAEAKKIVRRTGIKVQTAVGGTRKREGLMNMHSQGCHILVATPGRLNDILQDPQANVTAPKLAALVMDEADRMLDVGFDRELQTILQALPDRRNVPRQTMLFSATIPRNVVQLARSYVDPSNFQFVQTIKEDDIPTHEKVPQSIVAVRQYEQMFPALVELIQSQVKKLADEPGSMPFKAVIFFPTTVLVQTAGRLFGNLQRTQAWVPEPFTIHSKLDQRQRTHAADSFRRAASGILISSDVTARGMDFPNVTHVIQFGLPPDQEQYIHRIGRTGRADKSGEGWILVPAFSAREAKQILGGLPLKRNTDIECAQIAGPVTDISQAPEAYQMTKEAISRVPKGLLREVYMASFGSGTVKGSIEDVVEGNNNFLMRLCGFEEVPAFTHMVATKRGLARVRGIRVDDEAARQEQQANERSSFGAGNRPGSFTNSSYNSRGSFDRGSSNRGDGDRGSFSRGGGSFNRGGDRGSFSRDGGDRGSFSRGGGDRGSFSRGGGSFNRGGDRGSFNRDGGDRGSFSRGGGDRGSFSRGGSDRSF